jgi:hypothetical protein
MVINSTEIERIRSKAFFFFMVNKKVYRKIYADLPKNNILSDEGKKEEKIKLKDRRRRRIGRSISLIPFKSRGKKPYYLKGVGSFIKNLDITAKELIKVF